MQIVAMLCGLWHNVKNLCMVRGDTNFFLRIYLFICFREKTSYIAQDGLELPIPLAQPLGQLERQVSAVMLGSCFGLGLLNPWMKYPLTW